MNGAKRPNAAFKAHPRSRGEHSCSCCHRISSFGSSPLARGTSPSLVVGGVCLRLIPARAGNMCTTATNFPPDPAHPRSRGEHVPARTVVEMVIGSSPLARGTCAHIQLPSPTDRLIPARAGNIRCPARHLPVAAAHPRSRGEHLSVTGKGEDAPGSSPLARGTYLLTWGFTPYISKIESL